MYGWRGVLTGALALIVLEAVVNGAGADHVGGLFDFANQLASRFIDPHVPAIPLRTKAPQAPPEGVRRTSAPGTPNQPSSLPATPAPAPNPSTGVGGVFI